MSAIAHAIRNPVELMGAIASMATGGILEPIVETYTNPNPVNSGQV